MAKVNKNTFQLKATDLVRGLNNIADLIANIETSGKALDRAVQVGLCSVVVHAHAHGDYSQANNVIDSLSKGLRTNAARDFLVKFAPVVWNKKTKKFAYAKEKRIDNFEASIEFGSMLVTDWLSFKPESEFKVYDTFASMESLLKRATKAAEDDRNDISVEQLEIIQQALAQLNLLKVGKAAE